MFVRTFYKQVDRKHGTHKHTQPSHKHTQMYRRWPSGKEELDVRLLMFRGCHIVEGSTDRKVVMHITRYDTTAAVSSRANHYHLILWGSHRPACWLQLGKTPPHDYLPDSATLNAQRTPYGARPGPRLAPRCTRGPPGYPAAEREKTHGHERNRGRREKKVNLVR